MQPIPIESANQGGSNMYIILILLCCCCLSSSAAGGFWWTRIRPSGNMLQGYARKEWGSAKGIGDPRGRPKQTIAQCRAYATKRGYAGVGHRTDKHPSTKWRNTCFFYKRPLGAPNWRGNSKDKAHKVGCANPGKTWPNC